MADLNAGSLLLQAAGGLAVTVGLLLVVAGGLRRLQMRGKGAHLPMRSVAQLALSPKERLHVIEVGGEQLLIAVGGTQGPTLLRVLPTLIEPAETATAAPAFAERLAQALARTKATGAA